MTMQIEPKKRTVTATYTFESADSMRSDFGMSPPVRWWSIPSWIAWFRWRREYKRLISMMSNAIREEIDADVMRKVYNESI